MALLSEFFGPLLRGFAALRTSRRATPPSAWRRGLLIGADHIGDILVQTGSFPDLARATPQCRWSIACGRPADQLLETNPFIAEVIRLDREVLSLGWRERYRLFRRGSFDVVLCYGAGQYWLNLLVAAATGIPNRVSHVHRGFSALATFPIGVFSYPAPFAWVARDLAAQVGGNPSSGQEGRPLVYPTAEDEAAATSLFAELGLDRPGIGSLLVCSMFSRQEHVAYPMELYLETLRRVQDWLPLHTVFVGAAAEQEGIERAVAGSGLNHTIVTGLRLRPLYCFLKKCRLAFTSDSGIRHLANAAGLPVVYARNLRAPAVDTGSYCTTEHDVSSHPGNLTLSEMRATRLTFDQDAAVRKIIGIIGLGV